MKYGPFNSNLCVDYSSIYIQFYCKLPKTRSYHLIYSPFSPRQTAFQAITKKKINNFTASPHTVYKIVPKKYYLHLVIDRTFWQRIEAELSDKEESLAEPRPNFRSVPNIFPY